VKNLRVWGAVAAVVIAVAVMVTFYFTSPAKSRVPLSLAGPVVGVILFVAGQLLAGARTRRRSARTSSAQGNQAAPYLDGVPGSLNLRLTIPFDEGVRLMSQYKWEQAIAQFENALRHAKRTRAVAVYGLIAECYFTLGRYENALESFQKSLGLATECRDRVGEAAALGNSGLVYKVKGDLETALKRLQSALKAFRVINDRRGVANSLGNIGLIYHDKGELDTALKYQQDALKIDQEIGFKQGAVNALGNIGLIYKVMGRFDDALKWYQESLRISQGIGDRQGAAIGLGNIGNVYRHKNESDNALKFYLEALHIHDEIGTAPGQSNVSRNLGLLRSQMGAENFLAACLKLGMSQPDVDKLVARLDSVKL